MREKLQRDRLAVIKPNRTQAVFINSTCHQNYMSGLNQVAGKSTALSIKASFHYTGLYPDWYRGHRFTRPIHAAIGSDTATMTRDLITDRLFGPYGARGSGMVPEECIKQEDIESAKGGVKYQIDNARVKHFTNGKHDGYSRVDVFSYAAGWSRRQGYSYDHIGIDEEPPDFRIYDELSARLNYTDGYLDIAATPTRGESEIWLLFKNDSGKTYRLIECTIDDCGHIDEAHKQRIRDKYKDHPFEELRVYGRPVSGYGIIYPYPDSLISEVPFDIPDSWERIIGIDLPHTTGTFAAASIAFDRETDTAHVVGCYKAKGLNSPLYIEKLRGMGASTIPVAWPHDASRRDRDGGTVAGNYRRAGINMLSSPAHQLRIDGTKSHATMPIIEEINERMLSGRFKVFTNCTEWLEEKRRYRHEDGKVLQGQDDHLLDATHKAMMMLRYARNNATKFFSTTAQGIAGTRDWDFYEL